LCGNVVVTRWIAGFRNNIAWSRHTFSVTKIWPSFYDDPRSLELWIGYYNATTTIRKNGVLEHEVVL